MKRSMVATILVSASVLFGCPKRKTEDAETKSAAPVEDSSTTGTAQPEEPPAVQPEAAPAPQGETTTDMPAPEDEAPMPTDDSSTDEE